MRILGIETSCDETSAAIVEDGVKILSNVVATSLDIHASTGGIIPENAAREQLKYIVPVIDEALRKAEVGSEKWEAGKRSVKCDKSDNSNFSPQDPASHFQHPTSIPDIDAIAVTYGPGLIGSLLVGVEAAKTLAYIWQKPIIPINHLVAHLYANWLSTDLKLETCNLQPQFPALGLLVSGGHTDLVIMKDHGKIEWIGGTRDDAAGECFDKSARVLGLPYPGGPSISAAAEQFTINHLPLTIHLPRPMINDKNFDFSFSGLKTAVINRVKELESKRVEINVGEMAYEIQEAICDVLVFKTIKAAEKYKVKSILLAGGVSANKRLTEKFRSHELIPNYQLLIPKPSLCTDNAAYIASCAFFNYSPTPWQEITAVPGLTITGE